MDFTHVGAHCAVSTCNQQDFLPYVCDTCKGSYCSNHRTFKSHDCHGESMRDINSISCPVCHETVKFNRAQDVNLVWEDHFANMCSKSSSSTKPQLKCSLKTCGVKLGPSNKFLCPKCSNLVCLSHRVPEDHKCISISINNQATHRSTAQPSLRDAKYAADIPNRSQLKNEAFLSRVQSSFVQKPASSAKVS